MNSEKNKNSYPRRIIINFKDKINLKGRHKYFDLSNLRICYTWKDTKKSYKNNKFKISAPT